jgi:prolyl-tRNA synthetase
VRFSQAFMPTLKEDPAEAQVFSHKVLVRGGFMRKLAAGVYSLLPLGWRAARKIEDIVRQELDRAGAQEILMPAAIPAELWQESGRWKKYGPELLRFKDRKGADFCIGPTHEEVVVDLVRRDVKSYRALPLNLYQIQSKFRDELRPRAGLLRGREFIMKDAYSFDVDDEAAKATYKKMYDAYGRIFSRCGLEFRAVEADTGAIGGSLSHEFQVLATSGEDSIVSCDTCDYAANVEQAEIKRPPAPAVTADAAGQPERVSTPGQHTIEEATAFLKLPAQALAKTLIYVADDKVVAAVVRGDHDVNEIKLKKALDATEIHFAGDAVVLQATGAPVGFAGPVGLKVPVIADLEVAAMPSMVVGANEKDAHLTGVRLGRDFEARVVDLRAAREGDACPRCEGGHFRSFRGIEVGHVFFLGTKYSAPMGCTFLDDKGVDKPMVMGCYGIGITRIMAAAIEQNHDDNGIDWPLPIAPFHVEIVSLQPRDAEVAAAADRLYDELTAAGVEVLYDDRDERPGVKFKDADLIGIPLRLAVGKKSLAEGKVELKRRREPAPELVPVGDVVRVASERVKAALKA